MLARFTGRTLHTFQAGVELREQRRRDPALVVVGAPTPPTLQAAEAQLELTLVAGWCRDAGWSRAPPWRWAARYARSGTTTWPESKPESMSRLSVDLGIGSRAFAALPGRVAGAYPEDSLSIGIRRRRLRTIRQPEPRGSVSSPAAGTDRPLVMRSTSPS
jgi:hypothetical protein